MPFSPTHLAPERVSVHQAGPTLAFSDGVIDRRNQMSSAAKVFISGIIVAGFSVVLLSLGLWSSDAPLRFACYLLVTVLASSLKVSLPGVTGTMSVSYVFILLSIIELSAAETVLIGCAALLTQTFWHAKSRPTWVHAL